MQLSLLLFSQEWSPHVSHKAAQAQKSGRQCSIQKGLLDLQIHGISTIDAFHLFVKLFMESSFYPQIKMCMLMYTRSKEKISLFRADWAIAYVIS